MSDLICAIHTSENRFVLVLTGGTSAVGQLLAVPGGSQTILEVTIPYAQRACDELLGGAPERYCSEPTARAMASVAFRRALQVAPEDDPHQLVGIGGAASLASVPAKRGPHCVHLAWQSAGRTASLTLQLSKGARDRAGEESVAAELVKIAMAESAGIEAGATLRLNDDETIERQSVTARAEWTELYLGHRAVVPCEPVHNALPGVSLATEVERAPLVMPGAFHPLHQGHRRMAEIAQRLCRRSLWFELSIFNVDKPPLDFVEIDHRLAALCGAGRCCLTRAATFEEKATLWPGATFVVGVDTISRVGEARYYEGQSTLTTSAVEAIAALGCRFLVFGRTVNGRFTTLSDLALSEALRSICSEVPESEFREDVSSTHIRQCDLGP